MNGAVIPPIVSLRGRLNVCLAPLVIPLRGGFIDRRVVDSLKLFWDENPVETGPTTTIDVVQPPRIDGSPTCSIESVPLAESENRQELIVVERDRCPISLRVFLVQNDRQQEHRVDADVHRKAGLGHQAERLVCEMRIALWIFDAAVFCHP